MNIGKADKTRVLVAKDESAKHEYVMNETTSLANTSLLYRRSQWFPSPRRCFRSRAQSNQNNRHRGVYLFLHVTDVTD